MTTRIDHWLAAVVRGDAAPWPGEWRSAAAAEQVRERLFYHGVAGLIAARCAKRIDWPPPLLEAVRRQAIAQTMWELQHQRVLSTLLDAFAAASVDILLLKGSAIAYDLYPLPAARERGDSDVLIAAADRDRARAILLGQGFQPPQLDAAEDDFALQEGWTLRADSGLDHHIDLHWQLLNAPALRGVMPFDDCTSGAMALPRLGGSARAMRRAMTLLHGCVHRAMHLTAPYFVDGETYYGGDRLIWAVDIDLLANALSAPEWRDFTAMATRQGVARVCLDGLDFARRSLGTEVPDVVRDALAAAPAEAASAYLLDSSQLSRARQDLQAIPRLGAKLAYLKARLLPTAAFIRAKYPGLARYPLLVGHARRMFDLVRPRPSSSAR